MGILHGTFTEHVLATEDVWMGDRGETANSDELPREVPRP